jgi:hypothetical protein
MLRSWRRGGSEHYSVAVPKILLLETATQIDHILENAMRAKTGNSSSVVNEIGLRSGRAPTTSGVKAAKRPLGLGLDASARRWCTIARAAWNFTEYGHTGESEAETVRQPRDR